jgi:hypothetical protein
VRAKKSQLEVKDEETHRNGDFIVDSAGMGGGTEC